MCCPACSCVLLIFRSPNAAAQLTRAHVPAACGAALPPPPFAQQRPSRCAISRMLPSPCAATCRPCWQLRTSWSASAASCVSGTAGALPMPASTLQTAPMHAGSTPASALLGWALQGGRECLLRGAGASTPACPPCVLTCSARPCSCAPAAALWRVYRVRALRGWECCTGSQRMQCHLLSK